MMILMNLPGDNYPNVTTAQLSFHERIGGKLESSSFMSSQWRHNVRDGV